MASAPPYLAELLDDVGPLTADGASLAALVHAHLHRRSEDPAVRTLVVPDRLVPALDPVLDGAAGGAPDRPLPVTVAVTGGAGALEPAVTWARNTPGVALRGLRTALRESDAGDLAPTTRRVVAVLDRLLDSGALAEDVDVHVAPVPLPASGPSASWLAALDELAAADLGLALDAGTASSPVAAADLAVGIGAALDRELAFCCRGDLPHPFARDVADGAVRHGFAAVLLATRASLDGADAAEVGDVLSRSGPAELASATPEALVSARRWLRAVDVRPAEDGQALLR